MRELLTAIAIALILLPTGQLSGQSLFFGVQGNAGASPYTFITVDEITTQGNPGWVWCYLGNCGSGSPGGSGTPTSVTSAFHLASPAKDGSSMRVSMIAPANTNELYSYKLGASFTTATHFKADLWYYCDTNCGLYARQLEFDQAQWCNTAPCKFTNTSTNGTNYMFGTQCNLNSGHFELWDQSPGGGWIAATIAGGTIPCTTSGYFKPNVWHHFVQTVHLVAGDGTSCGAGYPRDYYDQLQIDGVTYTPTNTHTCAGALTTGFASVLITQVQMNFNVSSGTNAGTIYYDLYKFGYY